MCVYLILLCNCSAVIRCPELTLLYQHCFDWTPSLQEWNLNWKTSNEFPIYHPKKRLVTWYFGVLLATLCSLARCSLFVCAHAFHHNFDWIFSTGLTWAIKHVPPQPNIIIIVIHQLYMAGSFSTQKHRRVLKWKLNATQRLDWKTLSMASFGMHSTMFYCDEEISSHAPWWTQWRHTHTNTHTEHSTRPNSSIHLIYETCFKYLPLTPSSHLAPKLQMLYVAISIVYIRIWKYKSRFTIAVYARKGNSNQQWRRCHYAVAQNTHIRAQLSHTLHTLSIRAFHSMYITCCCIILILDKWHFMTDVRRKWLNFSFVYVAEAQHTAQWRSSLFRNFWIFPFIHSIAGNMQR